MVQSRADKSIIVAFKNELRNYLYNKRRVKEIDEQINLLYHSMSGLQGKGFDASGRSTNQELKEEIRLDTIEMIAQLEAIKNYYQNNVKYVQDVLSGCYYAKAMIDIYCRHQTYEKVCVRYGYSAKGLQNKIDKEIFENIPPNKKGNF